MPYVNRNSLLVIPKYPFIEWLSKITEGNVTMEENPLASDGASIYLVPEFEVQEDFDEWFEENYLFFFEEELTSWSVDRSQWPADRNLASFHEWFYAIWQSTVIDVVDGSLNKLDY